MNRLLLILAFLPFCVKGATDTLRIADTSAMQELYDVILQKKTGNNEFRWDHRRIIYQALGIQSTGNNDSVVAARIRFGWQQLQGVRISRASEPPFFFAQALRLALHNAYGALLLDAVRWKVDVNSFDFTAHTSLMDYLEEEYRNGPDEHRLNWLREYKQVLQGGGAVYFAEMNFKMRTLARKYERIRPPVDGLYPVQQKGKWGWVNAEDRVIIPLQYKQVRYFTRDLFEVSDNGTNFYVIKKSPAKK